MKIGASTLASFRGGVENNLEFFENNKIEYLELLHDFPSRNMNIDYLKTFNFKYTIHSPIIDINIASLNSAIRKSSINEIKNSIDLAVKLDCDICVVHPGKIPFLARGMEKQIYPIANQSIKEIGDYSKDCGVIAAVENMPNINEFIYQNIHDLKEILEVYGMYMTLDIGHGNTCQYQADEMYYDIIKHIHVHDNLADTDSHLGIGDGNIDFKTLINTFEKNGYDGIYMIETNTTEDVKKSLDYLKNTFP